MMKRILIVLCILALSLNAVSALAEKRQAPDDQKVITTNDIPGFETVFRQYNAKFYDAPSQEPGTVTSLSYTTKVYGGELENHVKVYLPYGYGEDAQQRYDIIYFYHGTNETQDSFIGDERAKNALDNMIETGIAKPFIMVFPTYYFDYEKRAFDLELFQEEMRQDIMPAVESAYSTYAETPDDAGFAVSRNHRAFAGYSNGCRVCWYSFCKLLDTAYYFLPMSNSIGIPTITDSVYAQSDYQGKYFVYACCGGPRDDLSTATVNLVNGLLKSPDCFSYGLNTEAGNNLFLCKSNGLHQTLTGRHFLYNAWIDILFH